MFLSPRFCASACESCHEVYPIARSKLSLIKDDPIPVVHGRFSFNGKRVSLSCDRMLAQGESRMWTAISIILTVVFGTISLLQYLNHRAERPSIKAVKGALETMSARCKSARDKNIATSPERVDEFINSIEDQVLSAKRALDTLLPRPKK